MLPDEFAHAIDARDLPTRESEGCERENQRVISLARHPVAIANEVYGNRMGNGPPESGDGWAYRGRGPIMITGRSMYLKAGDGIGYALGVSPDLVLEPMVGALVAGWIWGADKRCNPLADAGDFEGCTRRINGGLIGYEDRLARLARAQKVLAA